MERPIRRIDLTVGLIHSEIREHIEGICPSKTLHGVTLAYAAQPIATKRQKILEWLSKIEYQKHHRQANANLLEDTGRWLFNKPQFREWQCSSASGILWLHGIRKLHCPHF